MSCGMRTFCGLISPPDKMGYKVTNSAIPVIFSASLSAYLKVAIYSAECQFRSPLRDVTDTPSMS